MILLHFSRETAPAGGPLEYIVLVQGDDRLPEDLQKKFGREGFEMELHDSSDTFEWPSSLPTERALTPG